jgi:hypothetical protein
LIYEGKTVLFDEKRMILESIWEKQGTLRRFHIRSTVMPRFI